MYISISNNYASFTCKTEGAELISYKDAKDKEYLWQRDSKYWAKTSPVLFPRIGIEREKMIYNNKTYFMPRHGLVKDFNFQILKKGENSVTLYTESNSETKKAYPYDYMFTVRFSLLREKLEVKYCVYNKSDKDMPFLIGGHPAFFCPIVEGEKFTDYKLVFADEDKEDYILNYADFDEKDTLLFEDFKNPTVRLMSTKSNVGVEMNFPDYKSIAFWTPTKKESPFICLEPWNGGTMEQLEECDVLKKKYVQVLKAGEKKEYRFIFCPIR